MSRFYGNHPGTLQDRPWRRVKPATHEERLASMRRELENRERVYGPGHFLTQMQREVIETEIDRIAESKGAKQIEKGDTQMQGQATRVESVSVVPPENGKIADASWWKPEPMWRGVDGDDVLVPEWIAMEIVDRVIEHHFGALLAQQRDKIQALFPAEVQKEGWLLLDAYSNNHFYAMRNAACVMCQVAPHLLPIQPPVGQTLTDWLDQVYEKAIRDSNIAEWELYMEPEQPDEDGREPSQQGAPEGSPVPPPKA